MADGGGFRPERGRNGPYRPSNGSEGADFIERWCGRCKRDEAYREGTGDSCPIVANTLCYEIDDPKYPGEWRYIDGEPTCTAFEDRRAPDAPDLRQGNMFDG